MKILADHYAVPISKHNFSNEKVNTELRDLKGLAKSGFKYLYMLYPFFVSLHF